MIAFTAAAPLVVVLPARPPALRGAPVGAGRRLGVATRLADVLLVRGGRATRPQPFACASGSIAAYALGPGARGASVRRAGAGRPPAWRWGWLATLWPADRWPAPATLSVADVLWSSQRRAVGHGAGAVLSVDWPVAAAPGRPHARGHRRWRCWRSTTLLVAAHAYWWIYGWPAPPAFVALTPYLVCGAAAVVDAVGAAVAPAPRARGRRPVERPGPLEPDADEGRRTMPCSTSASRRRSATSAPRKPGPARLDWASAVDARQPRLSPLPTASTRRPTT